MTSSAAGASRHAAEFQLSRARKSIGMTGAAVWMHQASHCRLCPGLLCRISARRFVARALGFEDPQLQLRPVPRGIDSNEINSSCIRLMLVCPPSETEE